MNTLHDDFADTMLIQPMRSIQRRKPRPTPLRRRPRTLMLAGLLLALQSTALVLSAIQVLSPA